MSNKIAILLLIHNYDEYTKLLINHLSKDFDCYVHIDRKSPVKMSDVEAENVYACKEYKVYWGHYNMILATLFLLRKASKIIIVDTY